MVKPGAPFLEDWGTRNGSAGGAGPAREMSALAQGFLVLRPVPSDYSRYYCQYCPACENWDNP